ncbi:NfeD family protein [Chloroflexota bacterium]
MTLPTIYIELWLLVVIAVVVIVFLAVAIRLSIRTHRQQITVGREDLQGKTAVVQKPADPRGVVLVEGELWTAYSEEGSIPAGEEVIITKVDGLKLYVK